MPEKFMTYLERQIPLYPGVAPGSEGVQLEEKIFEEDWLYGKKKMIAKDTLVPTMIPMLPKGCEGPCKAVVVIAGGAFKRQVLNLEGTEIGEWLNSLGIAAFVLKCRLPVNMHARRIDVSLMDAQRAVRLVRAHAGEWNIDPNQVGVMGFSAGGHTASLLSTCYEKQVYEPVDEVDSLSARPDFCVLGYSAINLADERLAVELKQIVMPEFIQLVMEKYSTNQLVSENTPPTFLFETDDDRTTPAEHSLKYYMACRKMGVPAELHIFQTGDHGFGLGENGKQVFAWKELFVRWLEVLFGEK